MHTLPFCSQRHTMYAFGEGRWIAISKFDRREVNRSLRVSHIILIGCFFLKSVRIFQKCAHQKQ